MDILFSYCSLKVYNVEILIFYDCFKIGYMDILFSYCSLKVSYMGILAPNRSLKV